jgi:hypothetical protein
VGGGPRSYLFCHLRTSQHRKTRSNHATLRGFDDKGHLRLTSHFRGGKVLNDPGRGSEVWLYQAAESGGSFVKYKRPGVMVKILPQIKESRIKFSRDSYQRILVGTLPEIESYDINHGTTVKL